MPTPRDPLTKITSPSSSSDHISSDASSEFEKDNILSVFIPAPLSACGDDDGLGTDRKQETQAQIHDLFSYLLMKVLFRASPVPTYLPTPRPFVSRQRSQACYGLAQSGWIGVVGVIDEPNVIAQGVHLASFVESLKLLSLGLYVL